MLEQVWEFRAAFQYALCLVLFLGSLWKGASPEKLLSGGSVAMIVADLVYHALVGGSVSYKDLEIGHAVQDIAFFLFTWVIALRANRTYPLWIAGAQLISVTSHLYRLTFVQIYPVVYAVMMRLPFYVNVLAMAAGLLAHVARTQRIGRYPSWRGSFDRFWETRRKPRPAV